MNIFDLRQHLIDDYSAYIESFIQIRNPRIHEHVEDELFRKGVLWPDPLIQLNPMFQAGKQVDELVDEGLLHQACRSIFRRGKDEDNPGGMPLALHRHQEEAVRVARAGHSYVLTTGTGSGKSLAYIVPIVDYVLRHPKRPGIKAIVVYPMNALANSQVGELQKYLELGAPGMQHQVRFERYTGQEKSWKRDEIIANPPDILLTNYVMLELILTRLREKALFDTTQLRFLVLDELHTYRGRQGADVALLVRRVRDRLTPSGETLQCVGTSATLAGGGPYAEQQEQVAGMAERIFGCEVLPEHVIGETLVRVTAEVDETTPAFLQQLTARVTSYDALATQDFATFQRDPLSIWLESTFGVTRLEERLVRTRPRRISGETESAATLLRTLTGATEEQCVEAIKQGLLAGYEKVTHPETGRAPFAFRLHQFISKGDTVYATPETDANQQRHITLQYQQYAPGSRERRLFPLVFCRECGQEYYAVRWQDEESFTWPELQEQTRTGDEPESSKPLKMTGMAGFLYLTQPDETDPWPRDYDGIAQRLPDDWKEERNGKQKLTKFGRENMPLAVRVRADGTVAGEHEEGIAGHFLPAPFRFCLHCNVVYGSQIKSDFEKLARLSSEGRSTATTILSLSVIHHLRTAQARGDSLAIKPKMLSFTDNRQDASLQAGHFNDFVEIGLLRSALYCAVKNAGTEGLQHDKLPLKVFEALQLTAEKYAATAASELRYSVKIRTEQAMYNVLGYRLYLDLRRGWRITSPNLEQCGLLEIEYQDLPEICADKDLWQALPGGRAKEDQWRPQHELLDMITAEQRSDLCRTLLDYMRRELAIKVNYLDPSRQEEIKQQSSQYLLDPWNIDEDEKLLYATRLFPRKSREKDDSSERYLSGLSSYGRYIRRTLRKQNQYLSADETQQIIRDILKVLSHVGVIEEVLEPRDKEDVPGYQLPAATIVWRAGDGTRPYHDPLRKPEISQERKAQSNPFFVSFYQENANDLQRIQNLRAAEHTAQVPAERREEREELFRYHHELLPILYCSPTMELGVDIAELNVVNMRNIPPTPANYAQRSGRAGRGGQPALVFSYCSTGSSHDQYFFQHPGNMVSGAVSPPRLDLANEDLLRAHVHAIWLAEAVIHAQFSLGESLKDLLDVNGDEPTLDLQEQIVTALRETTTRQLAETRARRVLQTLQEEIGGDRTRWYTPNWLSDVLNNLEQSFNNACERWRGLYRAAQLQRDTQNAIIRDASRTEEDKKQAKRLRSEAEAQLELLTASNSSERTEFSDFYSYRYFASEGFLPGYNFPRLPLSAYIAARRSKQRDEYLSRPRFLAISEFAPRAIVYHEGSRYIINRSLLALREDHSGILTTEAKQCQQCGYLHPVTSESSLDVCVQCGQRLPDPWEKLFRLQNVSTRRRDKINSDEEERQRQGYEIRTGVRFPPRQDGRPSYFVAYVENEAGERLAKLTYGQAATLWRINFGPARRKKQSEMGFVLDTERGYWGKDDETADDPTEPMSGKKMRVIPYVDDTRNCLLFEPLEILNKAQMASLQAAFKSALQVHYQLEDNELAAEPLPDMYNRNTLLFYEATEGGAGVLRQLVDTSRAIASVAREALRLCHFEPDSGIDLHKAERALDDCEAACYHCLMTYGNQRDHRLLDRQLILDYLMRLTACSIVLQLPPSGIPLTPVVQPLQEGESELERKWLHQLEQRSLRLPTSSHPIIGKQEDSPDFLYESVGTAIYVDGTDGARLARQTEAVENTGVMVLRFQQEEHWDRLFEEYAELFRKDRER
jgi:ATP-dependent helicase YprA (DUF1998 family)